MSNYYQTVYDTGASRWVYYVKTFIDLAPLPGDTSPNWIGPINQHSVLFIDPSVTAPTPDQTYQSADLVWTVPGGSSLRQVMYNTGMASTSGFADNSSAATAPAMGMISALVGLTATLVYRGEVTGFVGLTLGVPYYLGTTGNITTTALDPIANAGSGKISQKVGFAKSTTVFLFDPNPGMVL